MPPTRIVRSRRDATAAANVRNSRLRPGTNVVGKPSVVEDDRRVARQRGAADRCDDRRVEQVVVAEPLVPSGVHRAHRVADRLAAARARPRAAGRSRSRSSRRSGSARAPTRCRWSSPVRPRTGRVRPDPPRVASSTRRSPSFDGGVARRQAVEAALRARRTPRRSARPAPSRRARCGARRAARPAGSSLAAAAGSPTDGRLNTRTPSNVGFDLLHQRRHARLRLREHEHRPLGSSARDGTGRRNASRAPTRASAMPSPGSPARTSGRRARSRGSGCTGSG